MIIQHNMLAANAARLFKKNTGAASRTQEKLASGYKINRSADDAAGLSISEKMRRQIRGLNMTLENMREGADLCQTADGALTEVHGILQRMNELSVKAANGTNDVSDRAALQQEMKQLTAEINRISYDTEIFGVYPLLGDAQIAKPEYSLPDKTIHAIKNVEIYDGCGSVNLMAEGMTMPFCGTWKDIGTKPVIRVSDLSGKSTGPIYLTNAYDLNISYQNYPGQDKFVTHYSGSDISFDMELTWKKVDCSTDSESREYFEIAYNFKNTSAKELTFDFWMQMDMLVGIASTAIPELDGVQTGNTVKWNGSQIPGEMTVDNFVNLSGTGSADTTVNVSAQYTWNGIQNPPDIVMSGDRNKIGFQDAMDSSQTGDLGYHGNDYFYGVGWCGRSVAANSGFLMQHRVGLYSEKMKNMVSRQFVGESPVWIQMGGESGIGMFLDLCNATAANLGIEQVSVMTASQAGESIEKIVAAIQKVSTFRSSFGAQQNRLEHALAINRNVIENTQEAESAIRDTDISEMAVKNAMENVALRINQSMLSQVSHNSEMALYLLGEK